LYPAVPLRTLRKQCQRVACFEVVIVYCGVLHSLPEPSAVRKLRPIFGDLPGLAMA
jgi:hypothetical protein